MKHIVTFDISPIRNLYKTIIVGEKTEDKLIEMFLTPNLSKRVDEFLDYIRNDVSIDEPDYNKLFYIVSLIYTIVHRKAPYIVTGIITSIEIVNYIDGMITVEYNIV